MAVKSFISLATAPKVYPKNISGVNLKALDVSWTISVLQKKWFHL
jgi:hypothetical protein